MPSGLHAHQVELLAEEPARVVFAKAAVGFTISASETSETASWKCGGTTLLALANASPQRKAGLTACGE
jgi:hypothetical protein